MATKRFCDFCGAEIPSDQPHQGQVFGDIHLHRHRGPGIVPGNVLIRVEFDDGQGAPDICPACVFGAVRSIDRGPVAGEG